MNFYLSWISPKTDLYHRRTPFDGLGFLWVENHVKYWPRFYLSNLLPVFSQLSLESRGIPSAPGLRVDEIYLQYLDYEQANYLQLTALVFWMSIGNKRTAFSLPIGPWQKNCSITHPLWWLPNKEFSQEEKFPNNVSLKITTNLRLYCLSFGSDTKIV